MANISNAVDFGINLFQIRIILQEIYQLKLFNNVQTYFVCRITGLVMDLMELPC